VKRRQQGPGIGEKSIYLVLLLFFLNKNFFKELIGGNCMKNVYWHQMGVRDVVETLKSDIESGLGAAEVNKRQNVYSNRLEGGHKINPLLILFNQFTDTMVLVLLSATVISGVIGAMADAVTIMAIVVINAFLGFIQEYRAERSLEEIKKLASPYASVLRQNKRLQIPSEELVPGDIVFLEAGDKIPADLRLIESYNLEIDEAALTGESLPVAKKAAIALPREIPLAERSNMCFMGTSVTRGRAKAIVVATGMYTVMGQIAKMMQDTEKSLTPLQMRLDQLSKVLIGLCLAVCTVVTFLGILRGEPVLTMFMAGISLAVAAIPEGLPAIVTVVLALGVQRMARRNAIVRKLTAVETLGCTTVICSDKTGTLTQNKMVVKKLATVDATVEIEGDGYSPQGGFLLDQKRIDPRANKAVWLIMEIAFNCNNSELQRTKGEYEIQGDPTEGSLLVMAQKAGITKKYKKLREIPFDSDRKMMSVVIESDGEYMVFVKGALDVLIGLCSSVIKNGRTAPLQEKDKEKFYRLQEEWASNALRVLGFAYKKITLHEVNVLDDDKLEKGLVLVGMCGIIDPPRTGAEQSVKECLDAGIIPVMITGDHPNTAAAIARSIGIVQDSDVVTGEEIDRLSDEDLYKKAIDNRVFARVSPQHKNRIVKVFKKHRHVVAMTGDGVNDAPAVKAADIGIAMGITGTQVTKEASSMILGDDNFSTIVRAVYEGRAIYDNIRKFIRYLLGCNIGEVLVMFFASLLAMPLPLLPIQILWVNLVTDGLPAMALGVEPPEPGIMKRKPRPMAESIFARGLSWMIFSRGLYISIITLLMFTVGLIYSRLCSGLDQLQVARTMAFTTLVFAQLFYVFECRSETYSPFELGFLKNKFLIAAVLCSIAMHLSVLYVPVLQDIFKTVALDWWQWLIILAGTGSKLVMRYVMYTWQKIFVSGFDYVKINA